MQVGKHLDLLGFKVEDSVTGFKGVVTSISLNSTAVFKLLLFHRLKMGKLKQGHGSILLD